MRQSGEGDLCNSQSNIFSIYAEQQEVSKAFQLDNFYLNERLNIHELRERIDLRKQQQAMANTLKGERVLIKRQQKYDLSPEKQSRASTIANEVAHHPKTQEDSKRRRTELKHVFHDQNSTALGCQLKSSEVTVRQQQNEHSHRYPKAVSTNQSMYEQSQATLNYKLPKPQQKQAPATHQLKSKTLSSKEQRTPLYRQLQVRIRSRMQKARAQDNESRLSALETHSSFFAHEGRITIRGQEELQEYERRVLLLWEHYELLSRILELLHGDIAKAKFHIAKYRDAVCTDRFEFLRQVLGEICGGGRGKKEAQFLKRLRKGVMTGRLLEHLSIVLLSLKFYNQGLPLASLTNMVGYASANLVSLIKLITLSHRVPPPLQLAEAVAEKELIIASFEVGSYGSVLGKTSEVLLRIEQNNHVMAMLKNKMDLDRDFLHIVNAFLKVSEAETQTLQEYPHYLFEFLAFTLTEKALCGPFPQVEIAPAPYLALPKPWTLVIEPWNVLLAVKGEAVFVRAHTEHFLKEVGAYCNVVFWTDLLPAQIDPLLERLPPGQTLYRHHCLYQDGEFVKIAQRLGCNVEDTVMIDRSVAGFSRNLQRGVELPWMGQKRDCRLLDLLNIIMRYMEEGSFGECVGQLRQTAGKRRQYQSRMTNNGSRMTNIYRK